MLFYFVVLYQEENYVPQSNLGSKILLMTRVQSEAGENHIPKVMIVLCLLLSGTLICMVQCVLLFLCPIYLSKTD